MQNIVHFQDKALRIFLKHGGDGNTIKDFSHLSPQCQKEISERVKLGSDEIPILGGCGDGDYMFLLTDVRLIQSSLESTHFIDLISVLDLKADLADVKLNSQSGMQHLEVIVAPNRSRILKLESGKPFFGLWNVLLFVASNNRMVYQNTKSF